MVGALREAPLRRSYESEFASPLAIAAFVFVTTLTGCSGQKSQDLQDEQAIIEAEETLNATSEGQVRSLIESYYIKSGSLNNQRNPDGLSEIASGPLLKLMLSFGTPEPNTTFYITRFVKIKEVHVLEYTTTRIKAIGCGKLYLDRVTFEGDFIEALPFSILKNIYVFVRENGIWKLYIQYTFRDPKSDLRDWEYLSDDEKQSIGDLQHYIDTYFGCDVG